MIDRKKTKALKHPGKKEEKEEKSARQNKRLRRTRIRHGDWYAGRHTMDGVEEELVIRNEGKIRNRESREKHGWGQF